MPVDILLLHQGVVPNVNLAMAIGIEHRWDDVQLCWTPVLDADGATSVAGISIAGDGAGIAGARVRRGARPDRRRAAARRTGACDARSVPDAATSRAPTLRKAERGRAFLDTLYRPASQFRLPAGDTIVCRCEEVTAQQIRDAVALGCDRARTR